MIKLKAETVQKAVEEYCFGCSQKRPCKITGTYRYEGETHKIYVCQWCRAAITKRQRRTGVVSANHALDVAT